MSYGLSFSAVAIQDHLQKWTYHGSHPFSTINKIIHYVVFNKVVHIIHPSRSMPFFRTPSNDRLLLPQAGIKSFNDLCIKSNSFCHLREYFCESPSLRCLAMVSWQPNPSLRWHRSPPSWVWEFSYLLKPCHMLISIILDVCIVSHLDRCRYVSFCELIVGCSIFKKIDSSRVSFLLAIAWMKISKARMSESTYATNQQP